MRLFGLVAAIVVLPPALACAQHAFGTRPTAGPTIHGSPSRSSGSRSSGIGSPQSRQLSSFRSSRPSTSDTATRGFGSNNAGRRSVTEIWNWLSHNRPVKAVAVANAASGKQREAAGEVGHTFETKISGTDATEKEKAVASILLPSAKTSVVEKNPDLMETGIATDRIGCDKAPCPAPKLHPTPVNICYSGHCPTTPVCLTGYGQCRFRSVHIACPAGQARYGGICSGPPSWASNAPLCGGFESRAAVLVAESRNSQAETAQVCTMNPDGEECSRRKQRENALLLEYQGLLAQTPSACRTLVPTYISLM